jgi:ATP-dependent exoDNAse (exonuclease V) beta subunit
MLALTFTNKAVHEMKFRILNSLYLLAYHIDLDEISGYRSSLLVDLSIDKTVIKQKAKRILKKILHEYAAFEVITLDSFTHKLIRTFAKDLKIPASFEVTLEADQLLEEMTEAILEKAGIEEKLTKVLVDYSLSKIAELKSWNIGIDLFDFSKLLLNENDRAPILSLKNKTSADFKTQKIKFIQQYKQVFEQFKIIGRSALKLISDNGLTQDDFTRKAVFNHFEKIAHGQLDLIYDNKLAENFEKSINIYNKSLVLEKKEIIDAILPELFDHYNKAKSKFGRLFVLKNILNQWIPMSLIREMERGLEALQLPYNRILLSRFNEIIDKEISTLNAPYIYERMGEKYRHYFIDEFQDTSRLQWKNLIPLISNSIESLDEAQQNGSLLLVGDPKQAIYRWRGGDNRQFLRLLNKESPFQIKPEITVLPKNYRSKRAIVDFNNQFFAFVGSQIDSPEQRHMFVKESQQGLNEKEGGIVTIKFIEKTRKKETAIPIYQAQTLASLNEAKTANFSWCDMAVLVRKRDQAASIASVLQENDIPFVSSESLSLDSSMHVNFLISLIRLVLHPEDFLERKNIITFLYLENEKKKRIMMPY